MARNRVAVGHLNTTNSVSQSSKKAFKGTVVVQVFKNRLRLCWSYAGKRYFLYIGLPDSKVNQVAAEQKARQIEGDIATGNFDPSLKKYKPDTQKYVKISVGEMFEKFISYKSKSLVSRSLEKYKVTLGYLTSFFSTQSVSSISAIDAEKFSEWLNS